MDRDGYEDEAEEDDKDRERVGDREEDIEEVKEIVDGYEYEDGE